MAKHLVAFAQVSSVILIVLPHVIFLLFASRRFLLLPHPADRFAGYLQS